MSPVRQSVHEKSDVNAEEETGQINFLMKEGKYVVCKQIKWQMKKIKLTHFKLL